MFKKKLFLAGLSVALAQFATTQGFAYTQNNLPQQHCAKGTLSKENPILINADLLYGRIIAQQNSIASEVIQTSTTSDTKYYYYDNDNKFGFRFGLGVALGDNDANISVQYLRQTSGGKEEIKGTQGSGNPVSPSWTITPNYHFDGTDRVIIPAVGAFTLNTNMRLRLQFLDLVVQTAKWMPSSVVKFQPFAGARYANFRFQGSGTFVQDTTSTWDNIVKTQGYGAFVGTDIRFMIHNSFHFFTNALTGVLAGTVRFNYQDANLPTPLDGPIVQADFSTQQKTELTMNPFWAISFGFMWSYMFSDDVLIGVRLAYEMFTMTHETPVNTFLINRFYNTTIKTQLGSFGVTVAF